MMYGYDAGSWFGLGGWLTMLGGIALIAGLVLLVAWAIGKIGRSPAGTPAAPPMPSAPGEPGPMPAGPAPDPFDVLRLRFARGEMTADEYRAARQILESAR